MSRKFATLVALLSTFALALPVRREVPQEHSHERFLRSVDQLLAIDNPAGIQAAVFGLLGNAAAIVGAGDIADATCLQQATADQAFTNAKATGNLQGQVDALIFRTLEKNTGKVGLASDLCTSIQAVNPEIAALQQHQDPASDGAAALNKAITLELARQIQSIGGNPLDALLSGTFAPGDVNDPTARGNTCNEIDDLEGCIFTQNLLVEDASNDEITAAVADVDAADPSAAPVDPAATCAPVQTVTVTVDNAGAALPTVTEVVKIVKLVRGGRTLVATKTSTVGGAIATGVDVATTSSAEVSAPTVVSGNLQQFGGALGGQSAPTVLPGDRGFVVENNASFVNLAAAITRSCDVQKNKCANVANSAEGQELGLSVNDCDEQNAACRAANAA